MSRHFNAWLQHGASKTQGSPIKDGLRASGFYALIHTCDGSLLYSALGVSMHFVFVFWLLLGNGFIPILHCLGGCGDKLPREPHCTKLNGCLSLPWQACPHLRTVV